MFVKLERVSSHGREHLGVFDPATWRGPKGQSFSDFKGELDACEGAGNQRCAHLEETPLAPGEWQPEWGDESNPAHPANRRAAPPPAPPASVDPPATP